MNNVTRSVSKQIMPPSFNATSGHERYDFGVKGYNSDDDLFIPKSTDGTVVDTDDYKMLPQIENRIDIAAIDRLIADFKCIRETDGSITHLQKNTIEVEFENGVKAVLPKVIFNDLDQETIFYGYSIKYQILENELGVRKQRILSRETGSKNVKEKQKIMKMLNEIK